MSIKPEFIAIVNYGVIGLIQLAKGFSDTTDMSKEEAMTLYDRYITETKELMYAKIMIMTRHGEVCVSVPIQILFL